MLTQAINWHWIFFVNVPIGVVTALAARRLVDDQPGIGLAMAQTSRARVLITAALMLGVYTIVKPAPNYGWGASQHFRPRRGLDRAASGVLVREARAASPLMPLRIFRSRTVAART